MRVSFVVYEKCASFFKPTNLKIPPEPKLSRSAKKKEKSKHGLLCEKCKPYIKSARQRIRGNTHMIYCSQYSFALMPIVSVWLELVPFPEAGGRSSRGINSALSACSPQC